MRTMCNPFYVLLALLLFLSSGNLRAEFTSAYHNQQHIERLESLRAKAANQVSKNLNRFGLETLKQYDILSDTLFANELRDTVAGIEEAFERKSASTQQEIATNRGAISQNDIQQAEAQTRFFRLFRKSLLALGVWLLIVFIIIRIRNKNVRRSEAALAVIKLQSQHISSSHASGSAALIKLDESSTVFAEKASELADVITRLGTYHEQLPAGNPAIDTVVAYLPQLEKVATALHREAELTQRFASQRLEAESEKVNTSVNTVCDQIMEIAYRGHCCDPNNPFTCTITRDLEKNLQPMQVLPIQLGAVLLNVLDNAFLAVKDRAAKGEKGYEPKVAISTRILPRFLQIRIKDNGDGIPESIRETVTTPFFTSRPEGRGAGIGLSEAKRILTQLQQGELVIESETGKGTDVYIKLFR